MEARDRYVEEIRVDQRRRLDEAEATMPDPLGDEIAAEWRRGIDTRLREIDPLGDSFGRDAE